MSKKSIYLIQVGFAFDRSLYFPCAAGAIAAYALADDFVKQTYEFKEFIFKREKLDAVISGMEEPFLAGFSCCVWNFEYNKALAKKLKTAFPECLIVFGGHNIPEGSSLLEEEDYIDVLVHGEGEEPFLELLKALPKANLPTVPNIAYREHSSIVETKKEDSSDIENYPSPYLSGVFDRLISKNPDVDFLAVLETNRGCPFSCSYCDWCAGKAVRFFPMERIKAEIRWMSDNKIEYCFCADSNFGMFPRDLEIVDYIVDMKIKTGYPKVFRPCYAKNSDDNVFQISKTLNSVEMDKGATLAYQTLSDDALINVNRKNLTLDKFANILSKYNEAGIPSYSELILGLPGETYDSFCGGICELLEAGQHNSISVYHCEMLVNSEMAQKEYIERHGIQVAKVPFNHIHSADKKEEVMEYSYLVVGTNTMSNAMWVKSNMFSICVQCFHNLGLLRCFAIYQHYENNVSYLDFYNKLLDYILSAEGTLLQILFKGFEEELKNLETGKWMYHNEFFGDATWFFEEGAFLELVRDYDRFWGEVTPFLESLGIKNELYENLAAYQKAIVKRPGVSAAEVILHYDLGAYFGAVYSGKRGTLQKKPNKLYTAGENRTPDWKEFARETVWFGRRRGATLRINNKGETETEYLTE
jgi:radical SAM superfamily enzyme YgiQ (UPF0313 family)